MKKSTTEETIIGFKGFDKDLKCRDFQYELGKEYEEPTAVICNKGFHFCENPLDIFNYYPTGESRFATVEGSGEISKETNGSDTKVSVSKIKIGVELGLQQIIEKGIKFIFERTTLTSESTNTKEKLQASNSGDRGAASNSGYSGAASNSGDSGAASNSGYSGAASNSGYRGAASNSGYSGAASNSGDSGAAFTIASWSSAETNAEKSVAVAVGYANKAKGNIGAWLVIAERNDEEEILTILSKKVDGKKIKADTFYKVESGKMVEC